MQVSDHGPYAHARQVVRQVNGYDSDLLTPGLDVVFCGLNPAASAVADGHNFSHRNNRFWTVLHLAGFTDTRLRPEDERRLLEYGCGITAVVDRPTVSAQAISSEEFRQARPSFEAKIRRYEPRVVAFLGKRGLAAMTGNPRLDWGLQAPEFAGTAAWVLPNPSGLNRQFTLTALVDAYSALRTVVSRPAE
jgi:TDG/mug DNA glycosylase family protein